MKATLENTMGYSQADLDRFNEYVNQFYKNIDDDIEKDSIYKIMSQRYLTDNPDQWDF